MNESTVQAISRELNVQMKSLATRYLGAEQVSANNDDADCYHEVRVGARVALVHDAAK